MSFPGSVQMDAESGVLNSACTLGPGKAFRICRRYLPLNPITIPAPFVFGGRDFTMSGQDFRG